MSVKTVYFVRHGQSADNIRPVIQSSHSPLSPEGRQQARIIANRIVGINFDLLVSSPLLRAKQTSEEIARVAGCDIVFSDLFVERIKPHSIEGKPLSDQAATKIFVDWKNSLFEKGSRIEDGENYGDIVSRAKQALHMLSCRGENSIVVVTHGFFMRVMLSCILLEDDITGRHLRRLEAKIKNENSGITIVSYPHNFDGDTGWQIVTLNDHLHLDLVNS